MSVDVSLDGTRHDRDIRLGLGQSIERNRRVFTAVMLRPEGAIQDLPDLHDRRRVTATLRLLDDEKPVEQFEPLVVEEALLDEPVVLHPGDATRLQGRE